MNMQITTILDHIDNGHMALPEFQRGYVWNREQVRGMLDSLYKRHPIGGLLVWVTETEHAVHRGGGPLTPGVVKLLLDGQQRMTSLYGIIRGKAPRFFDGNSWAFTDLRFNLETETFAFHQPVKMRDDPLWIDVTALLKQGPDGLGKYIAIFNEREDTQARVGEYASRLSLLLGIKDIDLHVEEVTGKDKTLDVVVNIFNRVNSGGTKLSKGDLALAKICADWPAARGVLKSRLKEWEKNGFYFNLDWLLRSVNTLVTGEAQFQYLHEKTALEIEEGLKRARKHIDTSLNMISGRLGLDHDRVLFARFAIPVIVRYLDQNKKALSEVERDKLLFWFIQCGMWGRFSGSTESKIDQDIEALSGEAGGLDKLLEQLRLWHGGLKVEAGHFTGWSLGARFYPILYWLTRTGEARDWGTGLPLKAELVGRLNSLEVHHICPKAQLYKHGYVKSEVNALANFCFLTKGTNLSISDRRPEEYFPEIEAQHPGALESQWIPMDPQLWTLENYPRFLEARKALLAIEANRQLALLLHGETRWLEGPAVVDEATQVFGGISDEDEEAELQGVNDWMESIQLPLGVLGYEQADADTGVLQASLDLAWPTGVQEGLSDPVALLLNEPNETLAVASQAGFRCFTTTAAFKQYVEAEIVGNGTS